MVNECSMSEDCPGYDRDRRVCLVRPDDCEFSSADDEADPLLTTSEVLPPDAPRP